jgi:hypothetical protein
MLVLGVQARWVAIALLPILAGATWVHSGNGWVFDSAHGGWEYPAYLTLLAFVQFLLGDGALALSKSAPILPQGAMQLSPHSPREGLKCHKRLPSSATICAPTYSAPSSR